MKITVCTTFIVYFFTYLHLLCIHIFSFVYISICCFYVLKYIIFTVTFTAYVHRINQLTPHPNQPSSLISAASGNNEVSIWDMETAARRQMVWASPAQPFGAMTDNVSVVKKKMKKKERKRNIIFIIMILMCSAICMNSSPSSLCIGVEG